jgi:hypothetical protein
MKNTNNIIYLAIALIFLSGVGYFAYTFLHKTETQKKQTSAGDEEALDSQNSFGGRPSAGRQGEGRPRGDFKPLHGTISSISGNSIIMKSDDGSTKTINISDSTRISAEENGQINTLQFSDLKQNDEINVMASDTTQSTIDAKMIFIGSMPTMEQRPSNQNSETYNQNYLDGPSGESYN